MTSCPWQNVVFRPYDGLLESDQQLEHKSYDIPARRFYMMTPRGHEGPVWQGMEDKIAPIAEVLAIFESGSPEDWEHHLSHAYSLYMSNSKSHKASWVRDVDHENVEVYKAYKNWRMLKAMYRR
jgi:hypothetical protein